MKADLMDVAKDMGYSVASSTQVDPKSSPKDLE